MAAVFSGILYLDNFLVKQSPILCLPVVVFLHACMVFDFFFLQNIGSQFHCIVMIFFLNLRILNIE